MIGSLARSTRRRETQRPALVVLSALLTFALIGLFVTVMVRAPREVPLLDYKTVYASLPETGNLRIHAEVRANGVRVGEVVDVQSDGAMARVRLKLDPGVLDDLPADTTASVRGKGLLGARSVLLETGTSGERLAENATMPPGRNPLTLSVTDAIETFDAETRGALGTAVAELGRGLLGRSRELNRAVAVAAPTGSRFNAAVEAILERDGAAERLVPSLERGVGAIERGVDDIAGGVAAGDRALRPFADRRSAVRALLREAPPTLGAMAPAMAESRRLVAAVAALARASRKTLPTAPSAVRRAARLLREGAPPLARAERLLDDLRPAVPAALRLTSAARPVLEPSGRLVRGSLPVVQELGLHACDLVDFGDNWRSTLNQGTAGGGLIGPLTAFRVNVLAAPESISGFGRQPGAMDRSAFQEPCKFSVPQQVFPVPGSARRAGR